MAEWVAVQVWHFTTLLSTFIEVIDNLPTDADQLVNEILREFPDRPSAEDISGFLNNSRRV